MRLIIIFLVIWCLALRSQTQSINVTENTLKISGMQEEIFYYSFSAGDQIVFSFSELKNRGLKEVEIIEYPTNSKFMEFKAPRIENKIITVSKTSVYLFRLKNTALFARICKVKIDRIPASPQSLNFNTAVKWVEKPDTTWNIYRKEVLVGYDTLFEQKKVREKVKTVLSEDLFMVKDQRVHSKTNSNGNKTSVFYTVPTYNSTEFEKKNVTTIAYWIGVGDEANKQWDENVKIMKEVAMVGAGFFVSPLGAFAIGSVADLVIPNIGEDVYYALVDEENKNLFFSGQPYRLYDEGKGVAGYKKFSNSPLLHGTWYVILSNDNIAMGINVNIKVSAIVQTDYYEDRQYIEKKINARYETKLFREPLVRYNKVPIVFN
jgi:hypothetical protein